MAIYHRRLTESKWELISFTEQMANIGSETERALIWRKKANRSYFLLSFYRLRELLDMTIIDKKNKKRLKELTRLRETLNDYFFFDNEYKSSEKSWKLYFYPFMYLLRKNR